MDNKLFLKSRQPASIMPNVETGKVRNISNGPSKYDLMIALFEPRGANTRTVEIMMEDGSLHVASVSKVEIEDGSGEKFMIVGYVWGDDNSRRPYYGYFQTNKRTGWLKFTAD